MTAPMRPMPRLSVTLAGLFPAALDRCMNCGTAGDVDRWQEHDESDRPEPIIILLCARCSASIVEPHPRLYRKLDLWEPMPGSMEICADCTRRDGTRCTHPDLKANGGAGLQIAFPQPTRAHLCRSPRRLSGWITLWQGPATSCFGRNPSEFHPESTPSPQVHR